MGELESDSERPHDVVVTPQSFPGQHRGPDETPAESDAALSAAGGS
jgi:hypothetical protein